MVRNARGTGKFQPVGGVYKLWETRKPNLKTCIRLWMMTKFRLMNRQEMIIGLRLANQHLRKFVKRFDNGASREQLHDLSREFREEMVDTA